MREFLSKKEKEEEKHVAASKKGAVSAGEGDPEDKDKEEDKDGEDQVPATPEGSKGFKYDPPEDLLLTDEDVDFGRKMDNRTHLPYLWSLLGLQEQFMCFDDNLTSALNKSCPSKLFVPLEY